MAEHSTIIGGSRAAQRINCPGSYQLEAKMPKQPDSDYAREGSMLHAAMELILTSDVRGDSLAKIDELLGQTMGEEYKDLPITQEHIDAKLKPATQAFWDLVKEHDIDDWFIEARVSLGSIIPGAFGTVDILGKSTAQKRLWVIDWKFGDGVSVEAEGNYQLGFYAGCALYENEDEEINAFAADIENIGFAIVQPRAGANRITDYWLTSVEWVEDLVDLAVAAVQQAKLPDPPIKAGSHCRWCQARPICPAHNALATDALTHKPQGATSVELAILLEKAELLKRWVNDVYAMAQRELENGATIPGWKLVPKQPRRQWIDQAAAAFELRKRFKIAQIYTKELISPTQAEKLNKKVYAKVLADFVESKSSGVTIALDSDKREAVVDSFALLANAFQSANIKVNGNE